MKKILLSLVFSTILLASGCFGDADSADNSAIVGLGTLEYVDGKFSDNGFVQFNSLKKIDNLNARILADSGASEVQVDSEIHVIHNSFSNFYSYFVSFGEIPANADGIKVELVNKSDVVKSFNFRATIADEINTMLDVREPGESADFRISGSSYVGCNVSTKPNILVQFSVPINPLNYAIRLVSVTTQQEIPFSVEFTKNPTLLIQPQELLVNNEIYTISFTDNLTSETFDILFMTKNLKMIFQTLPMQEKCLELVTANFMLGLTSNLNVSKIVEFNDFVVSATQGAFIFPESYNFVVLTSEMTLKFVEDFQLLPIKGQINLKSIVGINSADLDNDGVDEIIAYNNFGVIEVYKLTSALELILYNKIDLSRFSDIMTSLVIADVDNNGYFDFVAGFASGAVISMHRFESEFDYEYNTIEINNFPIDSIGLCDFNRDSMLDLAILDKTGTLKVFLKKDAIWQNISVSTMEKLSRFYIHDLNHDGYCDIIASTSLGQLVYLINNVTSFDGKTINNDGDYVDDVCFASGFEQNNSFELMIYRPLMNMIRTFSLEGSSQSIDLTTNKNEIEFSESALELNSTPNKIISSDFNNDRLMDILVISEDRMTVYLQKHDNTTESNNFAKIYELMDVAPENIQVTDLAGNLNKELIYSDAKNIIVISTLDYAFTSMNADLADDESIVDLTHFKHNQLDYLAVLTNQRLVVGLVEFNAKEKIYTFTEIQSQQVQATQIEIVDFNGDDMPEAILRLNSGSLVMFSQEPDEDLTFFQFAVDFQTLDIVKSETKEGDLASISSSEIVLYQMTDEGMFKDGLKIPVLKDSLNQKELIKNDIDHDGDEDIILIRYTENGIKIDVLVYNVEKSFKLDAELSNDLTERANNKHLRYVGMSDLDSDSWTDIVFCDNNQKLFTLKVK